MTWYKPGAQGFSILLGFIYQLFGIIGRATSLGYKNTFSEKFVLWINS